MHPVRDRQFPNSKVGHFQKVLEEEFAALTKRVLSEFQRQVYDGEKLLVELDDVDMDMNFDEMRHAARRDGFLPGQEGGNDSLRSDCKLDTTKSGQTESFYFSAGSEAHKAEDLDDGDEDEKHRSSTHHRISQLLTNTIISGKINRIDNRNAILLCDMLSILLICCNMAAIGWQLQYKFVEGRKSEIESAVDHIFCILFVLELLLRFFLERKNGFFTGVNKAWNWFDFVVVASMSIETLVVLSRGQNGANLEVDFAVVRASRFLHLAKIIRAVKVVRFLTFFRNGRVFILTILKAYSLLVWVGAMCFIMSYMFAILIGSRTVDECGGNVNHDDTDLCTYFGSVWRSCSSIYQAMLGGIRWGILYKAIQPLETIYIAAFLVYMTFLYCVVFQIVIGVFVVQVMKQSDLDNIDVAIEQREEQEKQFLYELVKYFQRLDINDNGTLCKAELNELFANKDMVSLMWHNELDTGSAEILFELLDHDNSGEVNMNEFVAGCVRLRGQARAVDVERIRKDIKNLQSSLTKATNFQLVDRKPLVHHTSSLQSTSTVGKTKSLGYLTRAHSLANVIMKKQRSALVPKTEMRAMAMSELQDVLALINHACIQDGWIDAYSGEALNCEKVNLYHFTYYIISPQTAAPSITLTGLRHDFYPSGGIIKQYHSSTGNIIAEAEVLSETQGPDVEIKLLKGQFFPQHAIILEHPNGNKQCGQLERILSKGDSVSYKEFVSPSPTRPDWFVSHWWGESVLDFVTCCQEHSNKRQKDKYWICAYANRQHELSDEIDVDPEETSFRKAMRLAEGILLVLDSNATPFTRIWCDFELYKTISGGQMLDIVTARKNKAYLLTEMPFPHEPAITKTHREESFPLQVFVKGLEVKLENGSATMEQDKIKILNSMGSDPRTGEVDEELLRGNLDRANNSLRGYFALAAWPQALKRGLVRNFAFGDANQGLSLPHVLQADKERTYVQLSLSGLEEMNDQEMKSLSEALPPGLAHLNLSFENCRNITDIGVSHLSDRISALPLHKVELYFTSCESLTDASLSSLGLHLPATVGDIKLNFAFCPWITKSGVKQLSDQLPSGFKKFQATFWGSGTEHQAMTFASVQQLRKLNK